MDIQPDKQNLDRTFATTVYYIDFYQRDYKWTDEPVRRLIDDVFYQFDEAYTKHTCLWTGHGFQMPEKRPVFPIHGSMVDKVPGSKNRANIRSLTPRGFAAAVFTTHHQLPLTP